MKFLRLFGSTSQRDAVLASIDYKILQKTAGVPGVELMQGTYVPEPDYTIPFYIDVRGTVTLDATAGLQMSTDGETWIDTTATTLSSGKTYFRVADDQSSPLKPNWTEDDNSDYDVGGNINSLVKVNFANDTNCYSFTNMFQDKFKLKSAGNLILPATTLTDMCYKSMFGNCTSLTTAPELPATTLAMFCYNFMFDKCASLTTAPELPATTLVQGCYGSMFYDCTSLTAAPELPATTLTDMCYMEMFLGCINLNYIKCLATDISASICVYQWAWNVAATGTFVKAASISTWETGVSGIPDGWTVQDAA